MNPPTLPMTHDKDNDSIASYLKSLFENTRRKLDDAPSYIPHSSIALDAKSLALRAIAFYLPQFHPFPENDRWWGKGFTEWTNVTRAAPLFEGHEQPKLPGELGFYDLRMPSVMERQVELAKHYGISGFCFHYYWFDGKRLLETPIEHFLNNPALDISFCLNWANENWTRRWDGADAEVLIAQKHSPEDDVAMMKDVCRYMRDSRYIRVAGRPVFMIYRVDILQDAAATIERWREVARTEGIGEIFVVTCRAFGVVPPKVTGADATVEFPPHGQYNEVDAPTPIMNNKWVGKCFNYESLVLNSCQMAPQDHIMLRTIVPGWDNTARQPDKSHLFINNTPELYEVWLTHMCSYTLKNYGKTCNLVFINAWNEWAEGAYLEPDRLHGYAYLKATADALRRFVTAA